MNDIMEELKKLIKQISKKEFSTNNKLNKKIVEIKECLHDFDTQKKENSSLLKYLKREL